MDMIDIDSHSKKRWFRNELAYHLPVWYLVIVAVAVTYAESRGFVSSKPQYLWTVIFPMAWFYAYRLPPIFRSESKRWIKLAGMAFLPIAITVYIALWTPAMALESEDIRIFVELGSIIIFALMIIHCTAYRTRRMCLHIFLFSLIYGAFFENAANLAGFVSETGYRCYIPGIPAPVYAMVGWATVIYVCVRVTDGLWSKPAKTVLQIAAKSLIAIAVAISLDITINPVATGIGCWVWHPDIGPKIMGVPLLSFAGRTAILLPLFYSYFWYVRDPVRAAQVMLGPMIGSLALAFLATVLLIIITVATFFGLDSTPWHLIAQTIAHPIETTR